MNWRRLWAIVLKELRQMRRDRITLAMIVGIPVMQLVLFGYAINLNLRGLSTAIAGHFWLTLRTSCARRCRSSRGSSRRSRPASTPRMRITSRRCANRSWYWSN